VTSIAGTTAMTIANNAVTSAKISDLTIIDADISVAASISDSKLANIVSPGKVSGSAITSGIIGGSTTIDTTGTIRAGDITTTGQFRSTASVSNTGVAINWNSGNLQHTTASCGPITFNNMLDGGTYTLVVQGTISGTCSFSQAGLTFRFVPANGPTIAGTQTVYTFLRAGTSVYVSWVTGYQ